MISVNVLPLPGALTELDPPAEQARQLARDREPEPGAAIFPVGGPVRLAKRLEDRVVLLARHADAGVAHGKATIPSRLSTVSTTSPCSVNLMALDNRLVKICCNRGASVEMVGGTAAATAIVKDELLVVSQRADQLTQPVLVRADLHRARPAESRALPASILDRSRMSLIRLRRSLPGPDEDVAGKGDLLAGEVAALVLHQAAWTR